MVRLTETPPLIQVFICTRNKDKGECCGPKGGAELRERLKTWTKQTGINKQVKITASLCLNHCEEGITACIQPMNEWFVKVDKDRDFETLKEEILSLLQKASS